MKHIKTGIELKTNDAAQDKQLSLWQTQFTNDIIQDKWYISRQTAQLNGKHNFTNDIIQDKWHISRQMTLGKWQNLRKWYETTQQKKYSIMKKYLKTSDTSQDK